MRWLFALILGRSSYVELCNDTIKRGMLVSVYVTHLWTTPPMDYAFVCWLPLTANAVSNVQAPRDARAVSWRMYFYRISFFCILHSTFYTSYTHTLSLSPPRISISVLARRYREKPTRFQGRHNICSNDLHHGLSVNTHSIPQLLAESS